MGYRNKDECLKEAERLGLNVEGLDWRQLQKAVSDALKREELGMPPVDKLAAALDREFEKAPEEWKPKMEKPQVDKDADRLREFFGQNIMLAPELSPEKYRLVKYEEDLGSEIDVEERRFDINRETDQVYDMSGGVVDHGNQIDAYHDYATGTFLLKNRSERRVKGMASVPKEQSGLSIRAGYDWVPVVSFKGKHGYLWKGKCGMQGISDLIKAAGDEYWSKYRSVFKDPPNMWYSCGQLVCDPYLADRVLKEIEEDVKKKRAIEKAHMKSLGTTW